MKVSNPSLAEFAKGKLIGRLRRHNCSNDCNIAIQHQAGLARYRSPRRLKDAPSPDCHRLWSL